MYDISSIKCATRKFLEVSRCSCAKQQQRNVQRKTVLHVQSCLFANYRRPIFFFSSFSLPSPLSITQFYILFEQTINIMGASLLALDKCIYYWCFISNQQIRLCLENVLFGILTENACPLLQLQNYFIIIGKLYLWDCRTKQILSNIKLM